MVNCWIDHVIHSLYYFEEKSVWKMGRSKIFIEPNKTKVMEIGLEFGFYLKKNV